MIGIITPEPPKKIGDIAAIRRWVEGSKGFAVPQYAEFTLSGCHVIVAWNSPFSGPASNFVYAYRGVFCFAVLVLQIWS
jgi:hypothetical protein